MAERYELREGLYYTPDHTWAEVLSDGTVKVGITDYAQKMLKTVRRIRLEEVGAEVEQFEPFGIIESTKATSDLISPVSGKIKQVNERALKQPSLVNVDPYGAGWLIIIEPVNLEEELGELLDAEGYKEYQE
ncbi:MAG: glycine cleavage system protein H [archaeon GB-1845-036]|nr:glycine cleavage system protein H [Candidatus Culexmicrobium thermophilum]RLE56514.1 MAG: glycine cleavage system protein H [Candidatus Verstraetearchaeota archaeon]